MLNLKVTTNKNIKQILRQSKKNQKSQGNLQRLHCNTKYKFLYTSFIVQNTSFNLTNNINHHIQQ